MEAIKFRKFSRLVLNMLEQMPKKYEIQNQNKIAMKKFS
jgi:hypothetical protein